MRPDIKRGNITPDEDDLIIRLHSLLGNRWSLIAGRLPGRTDNEIKNYWNSHLSKRLKNDITTTSNHKPHTNCHKNTPKVASKSCEKTKKKPSMKKNNNQDAADFEQEVIAKTKIYLPKPFRVSQFSSTKNNSIDVGLPSESDNVHGEDFTEVLNLDRLFESELDQDGNDGGGEAQLRGKDDDYVSNIIDEGCESKSCDHFPHEKDGMLDMIYEEYQQLIEVEDLLQIADSFIDY